MKKLGQKNHAKSRRRIFHRELAVYGVGAWGGGGGADLLMVTPNVAPDFDMGHPLICAARQQ
jgi:hypothetical protein